MKTGKNYQNNLSKLLDVIEHNQQVHTDSGVTSIYDINDFDLSVEDFYSLMGDIQAEFHNEIEILKIYNPHNEIDTHWISPPHRGLPDQRPVAEIKIIHPCGHLRRMIYSKNGTKPIVVIDKSKGVFFKHTPDQIYQMKFPNQKNERYNLLVRFFRTTKPIPKNDLPRRDDQKPDDIRRDIKEINQIADKRAHISNLITSTTRGFTLNRNDYEFELRP